MTHIPFTPKSQEPTSTSDSPTLPPLSEEIRAEPQTLSELESVPSSPLQAHPIAKLTQPWHRFIGKQSGADRSSKSLVRQLLQTVLPLAIAPLLLESLIGYWITQNQTQAEMNKRLEGQALLVSETVSRNIADQFTFTQILASNPLVLDLVRSGARKADVEDLQLSQRTVNDIEDQFASTKLLEPHLALNEFLARTAKTEGLKEIIITEKNGLNIGYNAITSDFLQSDEDWWKQGKAQTQWISNPTYDESVGGGFGLNLSQKIQDPKTGSFLGVVKIFMSALEFEKISEYLSNVGLQGSQQVQLLDTSLGSALVTYSAQGDRVPASAVDRLTVNGGNTVTEIATHFVKVSRAAESLSSEAIQRQLQTTYPVQNLTVSWIEHQDKGYANRKTPVASFNYEGKHYTLAVLPVLDWVAIASMDRSEIRSQGQGSLQLFGLLALVLGGLAAAIITGVARQISLPLNDLSAKAQQVSDGNLEVTAELRGSSETRTLAQTFNELVFRLKGFLREQTLNTRRANLAAEITGAKVVSSEELLPVFDQVVEEARDILASDRVVIYQFNPNGSGHIVAESVADVLPSAYKQQLDDPCIPQATREKYLSDGILVVNDVTATHFHPEHIALLKALKVKSLLGVPIISQGQLYGLLITHHCRSHHEWQPSEVDFLQQLGLQVGLVIERVKLLEQTRDLAEEQRRIKEGLQHNALQLLMDVDPVSQGNLTVRAKVTEDEIGTVADSYNATIASLRKIVTQVQEAARQVASTTDMNETSVQALSTAAAQQAGEILAALERAQEMANSVRLVATNAEKAEAAVQEAAQTVQAGDEAMNRTVDGILAIRQTVAETAKKVKRLGESSQKISNVVNLISGFAAQTNMLALNASIEASRAGEDGKGFAVVAEEVRGLARQSAEATTEIEKLVASIQAETNEVVIAMESGTEQVVAGTQLVDETRQSLNKITTVSRQISELVASIAQATIVQSQASETVTDTMTNVAAIANQNAAAANQVSASFEQLRSVAQALQAEVERFKVS